MKYSLIQSKYRCHCGTGIFLGYRYYPQPFYLLQLATKLTEQGHEICFDDCFLHTKPILDNQAIIGIGEYAADSVFPMKTSPNMKYVGTFAWLHNFAAYSPDYVFGVEPMWNLINFDDYPKPENRRRAVIRLSIGCPNHCLFCPVPVINNRKYHELDFDWSCQQLRYLIDKREVREISIIDDNLFGNIDLGKKLLREISNINTSKDCWFFLQEGIEVKQACDEELCKLLKSANFYDVRVGVETLDQGALKRVNKPYFDSAMVTTAISNLQKTGFMHPLVFLMNISDDPERNKIDIKFFEDMGCRIRNHELLLYPNTPLYKQHEQHLGLLL